MPSLDYIFNFTISRAYSILFYRITPVAKSYDSYKSNSDTPENNSPVNEYFK